MSGEDEARREHREWLLRLSADVQAQWLGFLEETRSKEGLSVDHPLVQMQLHDAFVRRMGEASAADGTVDRRGDQRKKRASSSADGDDGDGGGKLGFGDAIDDFDKLPDDDSEGSGSDDDFAFKHQASKDKRLEAQIRMRTQRLKSS